MSILKYNGCWVARLCAGQLVEEEDSGSELGVWLLANIGGMS